MLGVRSKFSQQSRLGLLNRLPEVDHRTDRQNPAPSKVFMNMNDQDTEDEECSPKCLNAYCICGPTFHIRRRCVCVYMTIRNDGTLRKGQAHDDIRRSMIVPLMQNSVCKRSMVPLPCIWRGITDEPDDEVHGVSYMVTWMIPYFFA